MCWSRSQSAFSNRLQRLYSYLFFFTHSMFFSFTPESIRWLLKKGRMTEARDILSKVAKVNGKYMPEEALHLPNDEKIERLGDFPDLFMSAGMVHRTLASWLMW